MDQITLLLAIEAQDKATKIVDAITARVNTWTKATKDNAAFASRSGAEIEAANRKAEASAASYQRAVAEQAKAQQALSEKMTASKAAQLEHDAAVREGSASVAASSRLVEAAANEEEAALLRLQESEALVASRSREMAAAQEAASGPTKRHADILKGVGIAAGATALAVGYVAEKAVKAGADFQQASTTWVTSAGEISSNLNKARQGVLRLEGEVGYSSQQLTDGFYKASSAGFNFAHGGLDVLRASAEGAKAENADLVTVTDALTSAMKDYHKGAGDAAAIMSKMVAATASGKMTFQEMAGSLSAILPIASAAHIGLDDILGSLASMTVHGMSAQQATQNMADAVRHLQTAATNGVMTKELALLGINAQKLSADLGSKGLSGTINEITDAIKKKMGPDATTVILNMQTALKGMTPAAQSLARELLAGQVTMGGYTKSAKDLDVVSAKQAMSFATLVGSTHQIGSAQKSAGQVMQSYSSALRNAMGDATGLNVALMIGGQNSDITAAAIKNVSGATTEAGGHVRGWAEIQGNFNQKMSELKGRLDAAKISLGTGLLPAVTTLATKVLDVVGPVANWMSTHQHLSAVILGSVGVVAALVAGLAILGKTVEFVKTGIGALSLATKAQTVAKQANNVAQAIGNSYTMIWLRIKAQEAAAWLVSTTRTVANTVVTQANNAARFIASGALLRWIAAKGAELGAWIASNAATIASTAATMAQAVAMGVVRVATLAWTAAQWLLNVALDANPIGLIVIAIAALIAIVVLIATKTTWFQDIWRGAWESIKAVIGAVWSVIKLWWAGFKAEMELLGSVAVWLWHLIEAAWRGQAAAIDAVWRTVIRPVFSLFGTILRDYVVPAFKAGVSAIGAAWSTVVDLAKRPVKFVVQTVLNGGIIAGFNVLAGLFGVHKVSPISLPAGFAQGGKIPGAPSTVDNMLAMVATGEYIMPTDKTRRYLPMLEAMRRGVMPLYPGDGAALGIRGYASGGIVGALSSLGSGLWNLFTDPAKVVTGPINALISRIPGGGDFRNALIGEGHQLLTGLLHWITGGGGQSGNTGKAMAFLRAQVGKPYIWDSAGPAGYDCSGLVSAVFNVLHGQNPYVHTFSTGNEAGFFPKPGPGGALTAAWTVAGEHGIGGSGVGHTAGMLAGLPFESVGGQGVRIGASVSPLSGFAHIGHFDSGGPLYPGWTAAYNGTGRTEYVNPNGAGGDTYNFDFRGSHLMTDKDIDAFIDRIDKRLVRTRLPGAGVHVRK